MALVVPGGVGIEALGNVVRVCTSDAAGPVSAIETSESSRAQRGLSARGGCQDEVRLSATMRPIWTLLRLSQELAFGS